MEKISYVRYEDFIYKDNAPRIILKSFFHSQCISPTFHKPEEFKTQNKYTSWNRGSENKLIKRKEAAFNKKNEQKNEYDVNYNWDTLGKYSIEEMEFVLSQLDMKFEEEVLGYNYDYVRRYIQKRRSCVPGTGM